METNWILRVGDGKNFINSSKHCIWGIKSNNPLGKAFIKNVKSGDKLWFVISKSQGKIIAVATYISHNTRELGPLINTSMTNEELGWKGEDHNCDWDLEIHYNNLYVLNDCNLLTYIKGPCTIRKYDEKCKVNLVEEYVYIMRYRKINSNYKVRS